MSKTFGVSATLSYDALDEVVADSNLVDYFELLSASKFTICPPGIEFIFFMYRVHMIGMSKVVVVALMLMFMLLIFYYFIVW